MPKMSVKMHWSLYLVSMLSDVWIVSDIKSILNNETDF